MFTKLHVMGRRKKTAAMCAPSVVACETSLRHPGKSDSRLGSFSVDSGSLGASGILYHTTQLRGPRRLKERSRARIFDHAWEFDGSDPDPQTERHGGKDLSTRARLDPRVSLGVIADAPVAAAEAPAASAAAPPPPPRSSSSMELGARLSYLTVLDKYFTLNLSFLIVLTFVICSMKYVQYYVRAAFRFAAA